MAVHPKFTLTTTPSLEMRATDTDRSLKIHGYLGRKQFPSLTATNRLSLPFKEQILLFHLPRVPLRWTLGFNVCRRWRLFRPGTHEIAEARALARA